MLDREAIAAAVGDVSDAELMAAGLLPARDERGHFLPGVSGNPLGQPASAARIRKLLQPHVGELVQKAVALALAGDVMALRECLARSAPLPKSEPVVVAGLASGSLAERAEAVLSAIAQGEVAPDIGERLLATLADYAKAVEVDTLDRRLTALEQQKGQQP